jgi:ParB family transcriptional regulator, chromosome partitioning protein
MLDPDKNKDAKKKHGLGRGLGSLFSEEDLAPAAPEATSDATTPTSAPTPVAAPTAPAQQAVASEPNVPAGQRIWSIAVDKIFPNKEQPRKEFDQEKIKELAASIKEQGILQPITVRKTEAGKYEIIAGERRWRSAQAAGLHEVPVIIKEADNKKVLEWALIENIQREDLNPIEEAEAYNQLILEFSYTHQALADKMGKERATITNALRILTLAKDVRELIREQKISQGHAKVLLGLENLEQQRQLAQEIVKKGFSVRATEKEVAALKKGEKTSEKIESPADRMAETLAVELQKTLGTRVKIEYSEGKGRVLISFYSDDELTSLVEKIKGQ